MHIQINQHEPLRDEVATQRSNSPGAGEHRSSNDLTNKFEKHAVPRSGAMSCYASPIA
jgi:hypothetical protein